MQYNKNNFRVVFMGTPEFAVQSLKTLVEDGINIVGVITSPDKPSGRGKKITESAVKKYALSNNLNVLQPSNLKDEGFQQDLKELNADLQIIVAFRMLPEKVWNMPKLGSINLHASLLPQYRGAAPINWAVINGETKTGVSTFFLKHEIDTGDVIFQEEIEIDKKDNAGIVHDNLMNTGAKLLLKTTKAIIEGNYSEVPQKQMIDSEIKHAPKIFKADCKINWSEPIKKIQNLIRGLSPYPCAWSELIEPNGNVITLKLYDSDISIETHNNEIGDVLSDNKTYIKVAVAEGYLLINELHLAGKKRMKTKDFLLGFKNIYQYKVQ